MTNSASSARATVGMSPAGSAWVHEPPNVPRCRMAGSATQARGLRQQRDRRLDTGVVHHLVRRDRGPDEQRAALVGDRAHLVDTADVDEDRGCVETQPQHREQRLTAAEDLGVLARLRQAPRQPRRPWPPSRSRTSRGSCGTSVLRRLDGAPHVLRAGGHEDVVDAEGAEGVDDAVDDRRGRRDRACLADPLGAQRMRRGRRDGPVGDEGRQVGRRWAAGSRPSSR